jgi:hypothetical protein
VDLIGSVAASSERYPCGDTAARGDGWAVRLGESPLSAMIALPTAARAVAATKEVATTLEVAEAVAGLSWEAEVAPRLSAEPAFEPTQTPLTALTPASPPAAAAMMAPPFMLPPSGRVTCSGRSFTTVAGAAGTNSVTIAIPPPLVALVTVAGGGHGEGGAAKFLVASKNGAEGSVDEGSSVEQRAWRATARRAAEERTAAALQPPSISRAAERSAAIPTAATTAGSPSSASATSSQPLSQPMAGEAESGDRVAALMRLRGGVEGADGSAWSGGSGEAASIASRRRQVVHTRAGEARSGQAGLFSATRPRLQPAHTTRPQWRQWWRRTRRPNAAPHSGREQRMACSSLCQLTRGTPSAGL